MQYSGCKGIWKVEILLQSWDYWHAAASFEKSLLKEHPDEYCGLNMRDCREEMMQNTNMWDKVLLYLLSCLECEFVVSLPSPVTHGLQADLMGSAVLPCPSLQYQCAGQLLHLGSVAPGTNSWVCFIPGESTEIQGQRNESPSWAHTVSVVWIGSSGECRSAEPQQEDHCAGVSFQSVRLWFHFFRIFRI